MWSVRSFRVDAERAGAGQVEQPVRQLAGRPGRALLVHVEAVAEVAQELLA